MSGPRLSVIPAGAVIDASLEGSDLRVLCLLGRHIDRAGWCMRSQVRMAKEINVGRATLQRSLERLCDAGWVQKKRRDGGDESSQPSASYAYRVVLDRDDDTGEAAADDETSSHADDAEREGGCPPAGTPRARLDGHGGAHSERAPGAHTYVGTNNAPLERPLTERKERDARARGEELARFIVDFEARWPTAAGDARQRTAAAAENLTSAERKDALDNLGPFLDYLKRLGRKGIPAGYTYLEEKRWTLLKTQAAAAPAKLISYSADSAEAKAIVAIHDLAGSLEFVRIAMRSKLDGSISYRVPITPRLLAFAEVPARDQWVELSQQQAAAWDRMLDDFVTVAVRKHLREGARAPWPWPPKKDGTTYTEDGDAIDGAQRDDG